MKKEEFVEIEDRNGLKLNVRKKLIVGISTFSMSEYNSTLIINAELGSLNKSSYDLQYFFEIGYDELNRQVFGE